MPDYGKGSSVIPSENPDGQAVDAPLDSLEQVRRERDEARNLLGLVQQILWDDHGDVSTGCATGWREGLLRTREKMDAGDAAVAQRDALRQAAHDAYAYYETWSLTGDGVIDMARAMERLQALASGEEE